MHTPQSTIHRSAKRRIPTIPEALENFGALPDSANVRLPVVCLLFACSSATVWRRVKTAKIPAPKKFGKNLTAWNVGQLREALNK